MICALPSVLCERMENEYIVDLHIHSKYSRACSKQLVFPKIAEVAALKGIHLVGTGDFTHPKWIEAMRDELVMNDRGLYEVKGVKTYRPVEFVPTTEVSCIYTKGGRGRRVHLIIVAPNIEVVEKINKKLASIGNIHSDGRPILGLGAKELLQITLDISPDCLLIPAHAWTPWFAIFGSKSGFDSLEECFEDLAPHVPAIETGLSSDPAMNWRMSGLDKVQILSNSDAHSLDNLGREANVFARGSDMTYQRLLDIVRGKDKEGFLSTIEFHPEEGKYHLDGHAVCGIRLQPSETKKLGGRCPTCGKPITVGVESRVEDLADRALTSTSPTGRPSYRYIVPLREVLSEVLEVGKLSKRVDVMYRTLIPVLGTEFEVLLNVPEEDIARVSNTAVAEGVGRMRRGELYILPGYDGVYGTVSLYKPGERRKVAQNTLFG